MASSSVMIFAPEKTLIESDNTIIYEVIHGYILSVHHNISQKIHDLEK